MNLGAQRRPLRGEISVLESAILAHKRSFHTHLHNAKPGSIALVAEVDGRIAGFGGALSQQYKRLSHHAEFGLAVLKAYWGQGIGRRICQCIEDWGMSAGLRKMYLKVFAHNDQGIALYKSLGYVEEGRLKGDVLRGDGTYGDTIIMAKFFAD